MLGVYQEDFDSGRRDPMNNQKKDIQIEDRITAVQMFLFGIAGGIVGAILVGCIAVATSAP